jgi:hypothetical protein
MMLIASAPFLMPGMLVVQRAVIAHEMTERLEKEELHEVMVERHEVQWTKPGKEFRTGNRLFDVKEIRINGTKLIVKGLYDDKEKEILSKMESLFSPVPFEQERSSVIYQLTHLETALLLSMEEIPPIDKAFTFPPRVLKLPTALLQADYTPPEMA